MPSDSDGSYECSEMEIEDNGQWKKARHKRKSRVETLGNTNKKNRLSQEDINNIILGPNTNTTKNTEINTHTKNIQNKNTAMHTNKNYSARMNEIVHKKFKHLFYITTVNDITRKDMSEIWETEQPQSDEVIIQTKKGFLIKTNKEKKIITETLNKLISNKKIKNYQETSDSYTPNHDRPTTSSSYSVIIGSVEHDITDSEISEQIKRMSIKHRYCKRIIAKANNKPTLMIRIITDCLKSSEQLLNEGVFYKHKHYPTFPSLPPAPIPQPCSRCLQFTHTKEQCTTPIKCTKCNGPHHYSKCNSPLPMKCTGCGSEEHAAWSLKCPKRPTQPIQGIPNTQIKPLNKKSQEIDKKITKNSKIHSPITIHDMIINTYISKINKEKNRDREELLKKLRKRFVTQYNIDTVASFSGNRLYILMFDLDEPLTTSPTEPIPGISNIQVHVDA